jgi:protein-tyrosine phosphatase
LTEEDEMGPYKRKLTSLCPNIEYFRFPIEDRSITSLKSVQEILKKIDDCLDNDKTIYLHCYGGIGRTGLIVGCWLASKYKSGKVALEKLKSLWMDNPKSKWTDSPETEEQKQFVLNWKQ